MLANAQDLSRVPLQMQFDPKVLELVNVDAGELLGRDGQPVALVHRDEGNGHGDDLGFAAAQREGRGRAGNVCTLTFKALAAGDSTLSLVKVGAKDSAQANLPAVGNAGRGACEVEWPVQVQKQVRMRQTGQEERYGAAELARSKLA